MEKVNKWIGLLIRRILQLVTVVTSSALSGQHLVTAGSSSTASSSGCTSPAHVSAEDRAVLSRGITRSSASYGIQQMLQEQVSQSSNRSIVDKVKSLSHDLKKGKATFFSFSFKLYRIKPDLFSFFLPDNPRGAWAAEVAWTGGHGSSVRGKDQCHKRGEPVCHPTIDPWEADGAEQCQEQVRNGAWDEGRGIKKGSGRIEGISQGTRQLRHLQKIIEICLTFRTNIDLTFLSKSIQGSNG